MKSRSRANMAQVAERAGVALSSVSRVLSGHPDVSVVMRNRVLDAVAALGYEPDILAQSMRTGATKAVGFVVGDISNPLLSEVALGAEVRLRAAGYSMQLSNSMNDPALDAGYVRLFRQRRVDGLLLSLASETHDDTIASLDTAETPPYVLVDRDPVAFSGASAVLSDHSAGIAAASRHLLDLGHRRIALINGNPQVRPAKQRATALRRACRGRATTIIRNGAFTAEHGESSARALFAAAEPPTAIIAGGNQILTGVLRVLQSSKIRVPREVSLITCDDVPLAEFLDPPLATISRDPREMGTVAADLLLERLTDDAPARTVLLPTGFRPTTSCGECR